MALAGCPRRRCQPGPAADAAKASDVHGNGPLTPSAVRTGARWRHRASAHGALAHGRLGKGELRHGNLRPDELGQDKLAHGELAHRELAHGELRQGKLGVRCGTRPALARRTAFSLHGTVRERRAVPCSRCHAWDQPLAWLGPGSQDARQAWPGPRLQHAPPQAWPDRAFSRSCRYPPWITTVLVSVISSMA